MTAPAIAATQNLRVAYQRGAGGALFMATRSVVGSRNPLRQTPAVCDVLSPAAYRLPPAFLRLRLAHHHYPLPAPAALPHPLCNTTAAPLPRTGSRTCARTRQAARRPRNSTFDGTTNGGRTSTTASTRRRAPRQRRQLCSCCRTTRLRCASICKCNAS